MLYAHWTGTTICWQYKYLYRGGTEPAAGRAENQSLSHSANHTISTILLTTQLALNNEKTNFKNGKSFLWSLIYDLTSELKQNMFVALFLKGARQNVVSLFYWTYLLSSKTENNRRAERWLMMTLNDYLMCFQWHNYNLSGTLLL